MNRVCWISHVEFTAFRVHLHSKSESLQSCTGNNSLQECAGSGLSGKPHRQWQAGVHSKVWPMLQHSLEQRPVQCNVIREGWITVVALRTQLVKNSLFENTSVPTIRMVLEGLLPAYEGNEAGMPIERH
jgi:hypothetical protein